MNDQMPGYFIWKEKDAWLVDAMSSSPGLSLAECRFETRQDAVQAAIEHRDIVNERTMFSKFSDFAINFLITLFCWGILWYIYPWVDLSKSFWGFCFFVFILFVLTIVMWYKQIISVISWVRKKWQTS